MSNNSNQRSGGIGFSGALFLVFLVLKLTDVINWSWWWVTAPLWVPFALVLVIVAVWGLLELTAFLLNKQEYKRRKKLAEARKAVDAMASHYKSR